MTSFKESWESKYSEKGLFWGENPDEPLVRYSCLLPPDARVLDLGCGDGRNLLYFAGKGFHVRGIDFSETAIKKCREQAVKENFTITAECMDIRDFSFEKESWDLIIAPMVLHAMKFSESSQIMEKIKQSTKLSGFNYISVLAVGDSRYFERKEKYKELESNTFYVTDKNFYIHYFSKVELDECFKSWKLIYRAETESLRLREEWKKTPMQKSLFFMGQKTSQIAGI